MTAIRLELISYKVALLNFGYVLDDAFGFLAQGHIPATLIPQEVPSQVKDGTSTGHPEGGNSTT